MKRMMRWFKKLIPRGNRTRETWEERWARDDLNPQWADREVSPEIVAAVEYGWLPAEGSVVDIGCGKGEICAWFAERGYATLGIDISSSMVFSMRKNGSSD